jgi:alpha-L-fucosidase
MNTTHQHGEQRLSIVKLKAWEALQFGMFIHFGMSTYDGDECSRGDKPATLYAPDRLNVDQWVEVARDAGMKYVVCGAKHHSGFCLWPTRHTDYHVGKSGNRTDVIGALAQACERNQIQLGVYYASWDNHNTFGSVVGNHVPAGTRGFVTQAYLDFQFAQVEELLTQYGRMVEVWIDIPQLLGVEGRSRQYQQIASLQPDAAVMMNNGFGMTDKGVSSGVELKYDFVWPTDLLSIERSLPARMGKEGEYTPWRTVSGRNGETKRCYIPAEVCDPIGREWFCINDDRPRSVRELLGMRLICAERGANLLLSVPPDQHGLIPRHYIDTLVELRRLYEGVEAQGIIQRNVGTDRMSAQQVCPDYEAVKETIGS